MSAPASSYDLRLLKRKTSPSENFQIAKLLSGYADYTSAKTLFHLDKVLQIKDVNTSELLFVGCVFEGGSNEVFHAVARKGNTKFRGYTALLDAGLNCKPERPTFIVTGGISTAINVLNNSVSLYASFKSAFYDSTAAQITIAESSNLNIYESFSLGSCAEKETLSITGVILLIESIIFTVGKQYALTLKSENSEGAINSASALLLSPAPAAVNLRYGSTLDAAIASQSASTVYISRTLKSVTSSSGLILFADLQASTYAPTGYYVSIEANELGRYPFYRVTTASGLVTEVGEIVSRHADEYFYFSSVSEADALSHAAQSIMLYYTVLQTPVGSDFEQRKYYQGTFADSSLAAQGHYVKADRVTSITVDESGIAWVLIEN